MGKPTSKDLTRRLERVWEKLADEHLDAFLVTHVPNIRYLTNFEGSSASLLISRNGCNLVTDGRYLTAARELLQSSHGPCHTEVRSVARSYEGTLGDLLVSSNAKRLGFESDRMTVQTHIHLSTALERALGSGRSVPELVATSRVVEKVRAVKDDYERSTLREAGRLLSMVAVDISRIIEPGCQERDVAIEIDANLRNAGFERPAFDTIVASGPNSALPHAQPSTRVFTEGDIVLLDFGGVLDGYCVDLSRVATIGTPSKVARRLHSAVAAAQEAAIAVVRPGVWASEVDGAARRVLEESGLGEAFNHGTGHGLGLEIHEDPRISKRDSDRKRAIAEGSDVLLVPGMVFTVEPGAYEPGQGGVRIEDDVLVTDEGYELLTDVRRDLWVQS
ncbi:MAG: hypothetical protein CL479_04045 [Acidobacteria bacterium]|nr:hypothetical protein [Acidobacteriota bacterium]